LGAARRASLSSQQSPVTRLTSALRVTTVPHLRDGATLC
jgi:hypothetical protein